jgi:hypothetical protein
VIRLAGPSRCSICRAAIEGEGLCLSSPFGGGKHAHGLYCSERCRNAARALAAIGVTAVGMSSAVLRQREKVAEGLLTLWRRGAGPEPSLVLLAAEQAAEHALTV